MKNGETKTVPPFDQEIYDKQCERLKEIMEGKQKGFYAIAGVTSVPGGEAIEASFQMANTNRRAVLSVLLEGIDMTPVELIEYATMLLTTEGCSPREGCGCGKDCKKVVV